MNAYENKLLKHQKDGIEWINSCEMRGTGGILADEAGLGKKKQMIIAMTKNVQQRTLIVAPFTSIDSWKNTLTEHGLNTIVLNNEKAWNSLRVPQIMDATYYLINYQKIIDVSVYWN